VASRSTSAGGRAGSTPPHDLDDVLRRAAHALVDAADALLRLPEPAPSRWHRAGVGERAERLFDAAGALLLTLFAIGWIWAILLARAEGADGGAATTAVTARISAALTEPDAPSAAYVTQAALEALTPLRGQSGKLRARIQPAGEPVPADTALPAGASIAYTPLGADSLTADSASARSPSGGAAAPAAGGAPATPGIWQLAVRVGAALKPVTDFQVITLTPRAAKRRGRIGLYYLGSWPGEATGRAPRPNYAPPAGYIEVTRENQDTYVSEHFRLRDFLTHDQANVWPKYLVLETRLIDKLELVLSDLQASGLTTRGVRVMSGFRTPQYNAGGGDPRGRAGLSRHMYGDAADIFIDNDGNGNMDDLNRDGRVNIKDARVIEAAVGRVEARYPALVGGAGVYVGSAGHGPFIHVDTRGYRARWVGTGDN